MAFLAFALAALLAFSGCATQPGQEISALAQGVPDVNAFLQAHPNAEITAVLWDVNTTAANIALLREKCGKRMEIQEYWYVAVESPLPPKKIELWINPPTKATVCIVKTGFEQWPKDRCKQDSDCADMDICTYDICSGRPRACSNPPLLSCLSGDGCCPIGCTHANDNDCQSPDQCGTAADCDDLDSCTVDTCTGDPKICVHTTIAACTPGDGCCPAGCSYPTDTDCAPVDQCGTAADCTGGGNCTYGVCSGTPRICSYPAITACVSGDSCCPSGCDANTDTDCGIDLCGTDADCDDDHNSTRDVCYGTPKRCQHTPITDCISGDNYCPANCAYTNDSDCPSTDQCDTNSDCSDADPCTFDICSGTPKICSNPPMPYCTPGDGCCPAGCTYPDDTDCPSLDQCDTNSDCSDANACTLDACSGTPKICSNTQITSCANGDGCCPADCSYANDNDCIPLGLSNHILWTNSLAYSHSCALLSSGMAKCWGDNYWLQLGDGTQTNRSTPVSVDGLNNAVSIAMGGAHSCALISNGTIKCWGSNNDGQLGDGTLTKRPAPVQVSGISNAVDVSAGSAFTCALLNTGSIKCWGGNHWGQLGDGSELLQTPLPQPVYGISNAVALASGNMHACAVLSNGEVKCWGSNTWGQIGDGTKTDQRTPVLVPGINNAASIAPGGVHTCAILTDGTIKCWGNNDHGQIGNGEIINEYASATVLGINNAASIALAYQHSCALLADGTIKCWGLNNYWGMLGDGTKTDRSTPVQVSGISNAVAIALANWHSCALLDDGTINCWGKNLEGRLGDGTTNNSSVPVQVLNYNYNG